MGKVQGAVDDGHDVLSVFGMNRDGRGGALDHLRPDHAAVVRLPDARGQRGIEPFRRRRDTSNRQDGLPIRQRSYRRWRGARHERIHCVSGSHVLPAAETIRHSREPGFGAGIDPDTAHAGFKIDRSQRERITL